MSKSFSISELKKEIQLLQSKELVDLIIKLAKYKKDSKEFLAYLLFQSHDKSVFISEIKKEIDEQFLILKTQANLYFVKKTLRKLLRTLTKYFKYLEDTESCVELLIYFCNSLKFSGIAFRNSQLLINLYEQQLKKINTLVSKLHEDLQSDYISDIEKLEI